MKITKSVLKELQKLKKNRFEIEFHLLGGYTVEGKISEIKNNIVYLTLKSNSAQIYKGWIHINDISGITYREA